MALLDKGVWGFNLGGSGALVCLSGLLLTSAPLCAQARLSDSLQKHVASKSAQTVDVIVHGSPDEIRAIAARHGLRIKKTLLEGAVLQAERRRHRGARRRRRSSVARHRRDVVHVGHRTPRSAPTRCRPGSRGCRSSPAPASASR